VHRPCVIDLAVKQVLKFILAVLVQKYEC
jgi:hypothetical protein